MRLWSLHPSYLDRQGLVALWREALLAQAVLRGRTKGYTRHPQLERFRNSDVPVASIAAYLRAIHTEAVSRGYRFDASKIARSRSVSGKITVTRGQMLYEWKHLRAKLRSRSPKWFAQIKRFARLKQHPLFRIIAGNVEGWERAKASARASGTRNRKTAPA